MTIWLVPGKMRTANAGQWEKKRKTSKLGRVNKLCKGDTHSTLLGGMGTIMRTNKSLANPCTQIPDQVTLWDLFVRTTFKHVQGGSYIPPAGRTQNLTLGLVQHLYTNLELDTRFGSAKVQFKLRFRTELSHHYSSANSGNSCRHCRCCRCCRLSVDTIAVIVIW
jgi:hypothetical protein